MKVTMKIKFINQSCLKDRRGNEMAMLLSGVQKSLFYVVY